MQTVITGSQNFVCLSSIYFNNTVFELRKINSYYIKFAFSSWNLNDAFFLLLIFFFIFYHIFIFDLYECHFLYDNFSFFWDWVWTKSLWTLQWNWLIFILHHFNKLWIWLQKGRLLFFCLRFCLIFLYWIIHFWRTLSFNFWYYLKILLLFIILLILKCLEVCKVSFIH